MTESLDDLFRQEETKREQETKERLEKEKAFAATPEGKAELKRKQDRWEAEAAAYDDAAGEEDYIDDDDDEDED